MVIELSERVYVIINDFYAAIIVDGVEYGMASGGRKYAKRR